MASCLGMAEVGAPLRLGCWLRFICYDPMFSLEMAQMERLMHLRGMASIKVWHKLHQVGQLGIY